MRSGGTRFCASGEVRWLARDLRNAADRARKLRLPEVVWTGVLGRWYGEGSAFLSYAEAESLAAWLDSAAAELRRLESERETHAR
jgi:hypothetical protein